MNFSDAVNIDRPWTDQERHALRVLRVVRGWTQRELAAKLQVSDMTISRVLRGRTRPLDALVYRMRMLLLAESKKAK